MKSWFFNLSTSSSVADLCIDYRGKYELVYNIKELR